MIFTKLSANELLSLEQNKIPMDDKIEGAEDILIQATKANERYAKLYDYNKFPEIIEIAKKIGETTEFASIIFARNIFKYQVEHLSIPINNADGQFDPPLIEKEAKKLGIDLSKIMNYWRNKLKGNWMGNKWMGRRETKNDERVYQWPLKSAQIVGSFTGAQPSDKYHPQGHFGIDLGNVSEGTPIFPIAPGTVIGAGDYGKGGNAVKIDHGNGVQSYYAHMNSINVKKGDKVAFNTILGGVGKTGNARGSVHLHLEITTGGAKINPTQIIGKSINNSL